MTASAASEMTTPAAASNAKNPTVARVLIVEDHPIVRAGLVQLIGAEPNLAVAAAVGTADEACAVLRDAPVDLVLLDLMLGAGDSLVLIAELVQRYPALKVLVLSAMNESIYAERVLRAGALGYIMKSAETPEVLLALRSVLEGRVYLSPKIFVKLFRGVLHRSSLAKIPGAEGLSDRELQVFQLIGAGTPNREIAQQLGISVRTVETHRENLKVKLGVSSSSELASSAQHFVSSIGSEG